MAETTSESVNNAEAQSIGSFAVLDFETSNLPGYNFNKTKATELCIYGFAADRMNVQMVAGCGIKMPMLPRVLHKITLLFNPLGLIDPGAELVTGLNNFLLEYESPCDENAANTVCCFLNHLQRPICLVAHNGSNFDFPILKQILEKHNKTLPSDTLCLDSLTAFLEIDEILPITLNVDNTVSDRNVSFTTVTYENVDQMQKTFDWRAHNETTPKRATTRNANAKRCTTIEQSPNARHISTSTHSSVKVRRTLFSNKSSDSSNSTPMKRKYPPKGVYKLGNMFERIFGHRPTQLHNAETDVIALTKLMLHYGVEFRQYALDYAVPFATVQALVIR